MQNTAIYFIIFGLHSCTSRLQSEKNIRYVNNNTKVNEQSINYIQIYHEASTPHNLYPYSSPYNIQYVIPKPMEESKQPLNAFERLQHQHSSAIERSPTIASTQHRESTPKTDTSSAVTETTDRQHMTEEKQMDVTSEKTESQVVKSSSWIKETYEDSASSFTVYPPTLTTPGVTMSSEATVNDTSLEEDIEESKRSAKRRSKSRFNWFRKHLAKSSRFHKNRLVTVRTDYLGVRDNNTKRASPLVKIKERSFWPGVPEWWWKTYFDKRSGYHRRNQDPSATVPTDWENY